MASLADLILKDWAEAEENKRREEKEQRVAAIEAAKLLEQEAEKSRIDGLRKSINLIDAQIKEVRSVLTNLQLIVEQAKRLTIDAQETQRKLDIENKKVNQVFNDSRLCELLAQQGINSTAELLKSEKYRDGEEIKLILSLGEALKEKLLVARESVEAVRMARDEAQTFIKKCGVSLEKPNYVNIVSILETLIQNLSNERKKIYYQTPEGQESKMQEIKTIIVERYSGKTYLLLGDFIDRYNLVDPKDIANAKEYGEDSVRTALVEVWSDRVDAEVERGKKAAPNVQRDIVKMETDGKKAKERLKVKLEKDWTEQEVRVYCDDSISRKKEQMDKLKTLAIAGKIVLASTRIILNDRLTKQITIEQLSYPPNHISISIAGYDKERKADYKTLKDSEQEVRLLTNAIDVKKSEEEGWFSRKKRKIEKELNVLEQQKRSQQAAIVALKKRIEEKNKRASEIYALSDIINKAELGSHIERREMTVRALMDDLDLEFSKLQCAELAPQEQAVFDENSRLEKKQEAASKAYKDFVSKK